MIAKNISEAVLKRAMKTGADFAEIYAEDTDNSTVSMIANAVESVTTSRKMGVGIRVFYGTNQIYAYGNDMSESALLALADKVAAACDGMGSVKNEDIVLTRQSFDTLCPERIPLLETAAKDKVAALKEMYFAAKDYDPEIVQVRGGLTDSVKRIYVANSEGFEGVETRPYIRINVAAVASDGKENQVGTVSPGNSAGFEFIRSLDLKAGGTEAARIAKTMLHASACPAGIMPVVMGNGFGGVIFHEACGHSLEATSVAKGNSVFCGKLGQKIASDCVSACDDGTMPSQWGSLAMNDEGESSQKIMLIENGVLKSYMIDKLGSRRMGLPQTGSGRRQDFTYAPTSRMTNTFICKGKDRREDIISSVPYGLYAAKMGGGSVNPVTGKFNFSVLEGYMIRNGQIAEPVRGATLIGKGHEILFKIDMVSDDLSLGQGMCGSMSGSVPTNVGQPMIRLSEITVGGKV